MRPSHMVHQKAPERASNRGSDNLRLVVAFGHADGADAIVHPRFGFRASGRAMTGYGGCR